MSEGGPTEIILTGRPLIFQQQILIFHLILPGPRSLLFWFNQAHSRSSSAFNKERWKTSGTPLSHRISSQSHGPLLSRPRCLPERQGRRGRVFLHDSRAHRTSLSV